MVSTRVSFQFRNERFFARSKTISHLAKLEAPQADPKGEGQRPRVKSKDCAEAYIGCVAQEIPQIDTEVAETSHLWMENS
jgi:hypothetical protein